MDVNTDFLLKFVFIALLVYFGVKVTSAVFKFILALLLICVVANVLKTLFGIP